MLIYISAYLEHFDQPHWVRNHATSLVPSTDSHHPSEFRDVQRWVTLTASQGYGISIPVWSRKVAWQAEPDLHKSWEWRGFSRNPKADSVQVWAGNSEISDFYLIDLHAPVYKEIPDVEPYRLFIIACTTVIFRQLEFHPKLPGVKFASHTIGCLKLRRRV